MKTHPGITCQSFKNHTDLDDIYPEPGSLLIHTQQEAAQTNGTQIIGLNPYRPNFLQLRSQLGGFRS